MRLLALLLLLGSSIACKSSAEPCQRQIVDCLKRCDRSGADQTDVPLRENNPEATLRPCEAKCQECRDAPPPAPAGRPTPTGTAQ